ncbi:Glycosyl transferase, group 1 [Candidatus Sulfotelmatobacter kueseliae]|uniref:Glycosyl transferase, group 1 n=1 Tax=Candidatus Sulfotelmatobacter kueseliae TaxID=2042962 RepID=A0A2U3KNM7_9BACT|nr:Glycosyl transferase, group 1 [Candidatus Sulfotelmatobacter kueseliae]
MHVLVTADTLLSGSWTYTRELVAGLVTRGVQVTLVSFGEIPLPDQTAWMDHLHGLDYRPTAFRLEWMQEAEEDFSDSSEFLFALVRELRPDVLHLNQFCYGNLPVDVPKVVMAHGDLITWRQAVQDQVPRRGPTKWYRDTVSRGIAGADVVVAASAWMLDQICQCYLQPRRGEVVYPGRNPIFFNPYISKDDSVLAVGRLVDAGKQVFLLTQHEHPVPVCIVGAEQTVAMPRIPIRADVKVAVAETSVAICGPQTEAQLRALYSRASIFAATARYDPLGMQAVEAALSRCAIVANDIPSFREIWGDAALYFRTNDAASLAAGIRRLNEDRAMRRAYAELAYNRARERFTTKRMIEDYMHLYRDLRSVRAAAA